MRSSNLKSSQGVTPKSSMHKISGPDKNQSTRNSKSPYNSKYDKNSFSNSNMSGTMRQDKSSINKIQTQGSKTHT